MRIHALYNVLHIFCNGVENISTLWGGGVRGVHPVVAPRRTTLRGHRPRV